MCGIAGIIDFSNKKIEEQVIRDMCSKMTHRGPDDEGVYTGQANGTCAGLGHRRLKIIDLSTAGHQPMSNETGKIWIVLNGEIYNYKELRQELENKGHRFKSNTDTESVVHLYEEYGVDCVKKLRGMFAFAIWDELNNTVMLARDRVGKKPLLYTFNNNRLSFASEFCALLAGGEVNKEVNPAAVDYYLTFGYIPAPLTIYQKVFKLAPAHILIIKAGDISIKKYWELDYANKIDIAEEQAAKETLSLLTESVRLRLASDVPLGAFLSGGIDSSAVVGLMSEVSETKVKTFSVGFEDARYDELAYARNIARRFNTEHHEFIVRPNALEILPALIERYGEPYADSSCIPTYYVARETKKYVTVALNGDGGDELFAGYERYQAMIASERMPMLVKKTALAFSALLPDSLDSKNKLRKLKRFLSAAALPTASRYLKWVSIFDETSKNQLISDNFGKSVSDSQALTFIGQFLGKPPIANGLDALLLTDTLTYLPYDLLVKVDITSMANSLEARSPFLDHKLMEFVARLPQQYKMKRYIKKYLLKKAIKDLIPNENIQRPKMGFGIPVGEWFRKELKGLLQESLLSEKSSRRGYFNPSFVKNMVKNHCEGRADHTFRLWSLLMLELWHERFVD